MGQTGQTDLTFKLDFPGNLWRAAFAYLAMFEKKIGTSFFSNFPQIKKFTLSVSLGFCLSFSLSLGLGLSLGLARNTRNVHN